MVVIDVVYLIIVTIGDWRLRLIVDLLPREASSTKHKIYNSPDPIRVATVSSASTV